MPMVSGSDNPDDLAAANGARADVPTPDGEAGRQPASVSPLDELPSLRAYFEEDAPNIDRLRGDADWLRTKANAIASDQAGEPACLFQFAKGWLGEQLLFGPATRIFDLALRKYGDTTDAFSNRLRQQLALATYKDEEAPIRRRLQTALEILQRVPSLVGVGQVDRDRLLADGAETWALRGAVYRRMWDLDGKPQYIQRALDCYRKSHECDDARDDAHVEGYGALNAAFLLDSLAFHFESIGEGPILNASAASARNESEALRTRIVERVGRRLAKAGDERAEWLCETIAGACLGLGLARAARDLRGVASRAGADTAETLLANAAFWSDQAVQQPRADWKRETTHAQWLRVAILNEPSHAGRDALQAYWNAAAAVINPFRRKSGGVELAGLEMAGAARRGKVGLALSGGGFRASFYHLGVLARLAEADVLRHVDVLSTVSGGSIVGAHYYLLLRQLLEHKEVPTRDDYVDLVADLQRQFRAGVNENVRMRGLSNLPTALKLLFLPNYTRSDRMAELYDELLYQRTEKGRKRFAMSSLRVTPAGEQPEFNPRYSNWRRSARVPALLINATCLNTGHSWHFTANWMGEPPELIGEEVDKNERLRRLRYDKAPGHEALSLGFAVAASACVPGIFEPLRLPGVYPGRLVRLVDGGVHDNQGVDALLGQGCDFILCSDGSGQMGDENRPPNGPVGTPKRSMDILMKRVREAEHADLDNRVITGSRRGLFFVHLKAELPADNVDWVGCDDRTRPQPRKPTSYGIDQQVQRLLSGIRTDLDSFSEVEACALMTSGYAMATRRLQELDARQGPRGDHFPWGGFDIEAPSRRTRWQFLALDSTMAVPQDANDIVRDDLALQLQAGRHLFFKFLKLTPRLLTGLTVLALCAVGALAAFLSRNFGGVLEWLHDSRWSVSYLALLVVAIAIAVAVAVPRIRVWCVESFFAATGAIASNLYFWFLLNRLFLKRGRLRRLLDLK
jgi:predicted acylesterase/phospholipase RssA